MRYTSGREVRRAGWRRGEEESSLSSRARRRRVGKPVSDVEDEKCCSVTFSFFFSPGSSISGNTSLFQPPSCLPLLPSSRHPLCCNSPTFSSPCRSFFPLPPPLPPLSDHSHPSLPSLSLSLSLLHTPSLPPSPSSSLSFFLHPLFSQIF